jgi:hypothetical protein
LLKADEMITNQLTIGRQNDDVTITGIKVFGVVINRANYYGNTAVELPNGWTQRNCYVLSAEYSDDPGLRYWNGFGGFDYTNTPCLMWQWDAVENVLWIMGSGWYFDNYPERAIHCRISIMHIRTEL